VSHEAIYRFIYALPKGELATHGVLLRSKRTRRRRPRPLGERGAPIVGMRSIDAREDVADRRVPGHWEGDLIIGAHGKTAAATLVERTTRFTVILALPEGKDSTALADTLIDSANDPAQPSDSSPPEKPSNASSLPPRLDTARSSSSSRTTWVPWTPS